MKREIKLLKHNIFAKACIVIEATKDKDFDIERISAVDLTGSKSLQAMTGDFGMAVYNENNFGFYTSWKDYEELQEKLKITEEGYEEFLDNFTADLVDSVIEYVNDSKR